jgi:TRAP-type C4-dicarboxylate transport system permease small subunit
VFLQKFIVAAGRYGRAVETLLLAIILGCMTLLAFGQILLRNFFDIGLPWGDELLRLMVLWLALAGALAASRSDKHINVAILDRFLPQGLHRFVKFLNHLFTLLICVAVAWFSLQFVLTSKEFGDVLLGNVPAWWLQVALPLGFALMAWRYLLFLLSDVLTLFTSGKKQ